MATFLNLNAVVFKMSQINMKQNVAVHTINTHLTLYLNFDTVTICSYALMIFTHVQFLYLVTSVSPFLLVDF